MRLRARLAVVPLAAALLLTGCGRPGTAATVDGTRITDAQVAALVSDLDKLNQTVTAPQTALTSLAVAPTIIGVGADFGGGVSTQQASDLLDQVAEQAGLEPWDYADETIALAQLTLVNQAVASNPEAAEAINTAVSELDVEVNPRFGTWANGSGVATSEWPWLITAGSATAG